MLHKDPDWRVFLIGGHSATGKTTASKRLGLRLGVPWMMVDDLRLAFRRAHARLPGGAGQAMYFFDDTPHVWRREPEELSEALIGVGEALSAPLEVVIENHVDQSAPIIIEGDGILPSLLSRPPVVERAAAVRAVFLIEPDESAVVANMLARGRGVVGQTRKELRNAARAKCLFGQWLAQEATRYNLPVMEPRPWETLVDRLTEHLA
jgi:2-phosphoglycerate kinase